MLGLLGHGTHLSLLPHSLEKQLCEEWGLNLYCQRICLLYPEWTGGTLSYAILGMHQPREQGKDPGMKKVADESKIGSKINLNPQDSELAFLIKATVEG